MLGNLLESSKDVLLTPQGLLPKFGKNSSRYGLEVLIWKARRSTGTSGAVDRTLNFFRIWNPAVDWTLSIGRPEKHRSTGKPSCGRPVHQFQKHLSVGQYRSTGTLSAVDRKCCGRQEHHQAVDRNSSSRNHIMSVTSGRPVVHQRSTG